MPLPKPTGRQKEVLVLPPEGHHVVLGTAGSGKTTIAILRAAFLANPDTDHGGKTLLVTFNRTLVTYLRFLGDNALNNVVVENYHTFARGYLRDRGHRLNATIANDDHRRQLIAEALEATRRETKVKILGQGPDFFEEELRWLSQNGIKSLQAYHEGARKTRLEISEAPSREAVWQVYENYKHLRGRAGILFDWHDMAMAVADDLRKDQRPRLYRHIVIDEGQDLSPEMIRSLALAVPHDGSITVFADAAQQIYGHLTSWRSAGLNVDDPWEFKENYRNSKQIARLALAIADMPYFKEVPDLVEPNEPQADGPLPTVVECSNSGVETQFLAQQAQEAARNRSVAILVRTRVDEGRIPLRLRSAGVQLSRDLVAWTAGPGIRYGTYHAAKGLEFDTVILPFCSKDDLPDPAVVDAYGAAEAMSRDGRLLYVGVTRARTSLIVSYTGQLTALLPTGQGLVERLKR